MRVYPSDRIGGRTGPQHTRNSKGESPRFLRRAARVFVIGILLAMLLSIAAVLPLRWLNPPATAFMLFDDHNLDSIRFGWVSWANIGEPLPLAVIASEDQRFMQHAGIDLASIRDSVQESKQGKTLRGASTITQQVAKNLYLWRGRSFVRKGIEAYLSLLVDLAWPKQRILEVYLNIAEFGPGIYGVGAASDAFFGKTPDTLSDQEAALLAAVLPNPIRMNAAEPSAYIRERQAWIISQMQRLRREQVLYPLGAAN